MIFFNIKTIWYLILCIIVFTVLVDLNSSPDSWFPMCMFSIPYCFILLLTGLVYHFLFKDYENFPEPVMWLVKILFSVLILVTSYQVFVMILNFPLKIDLWNKEPNSFFLLMYSQVPTLIIFLIYFFYKMFKKE